MVVPPIYTIYTHTNSDGVVHPLVMFNHGKESIYVEPNADAYHIIHEHALGIGYNTAYIVHDKNPTLKYEWCVVYKANHFSGQWLMKSAMLREEAMALYDKYNPVVVAQKLPEQYGAW